MAGSYKTDDGNGRYCASVRLAIFFAIACVILALPRVAHANGRLSIKLTEFHYKMRHSSDRLIIRLHLDRTLDSTTSLRQLRRIFFHQSGSAADKNKQPYLLDSASESVVFGDYIDSSLSNPFHIDMNDTNDPSVIMTVELFSANVTHSPAAGSINLATIQPVRALFRALINPSSSAVKSAGETANIVTGEFASENDDRRQFHGNLTVATGIQLRFVHWFTCLPGSHGPKCDRLCTEQDSDALGHYTCQQDTGDKVCRVGWTDPIADCKQSTAASNSSSEQTSKQNSAASESRSDKTLIIVLVSMSLAVLGVIGIGLISLFNKPSSSSDMDAPDSEKREKLRRSRE